ncbi:hypothetical protein EMCRGX_G020352 [Ephydatia muelleri]
MLSSHARDRRAASSSPTNVKKAGISVSENVNKAERNRFPNGSESSPPSTLLSSAELPGAHFLTWRIRKTDRVQADSFGIDFRCSPMHSSRKDQWLLQTIDSTVSSLPIPPARKPRVHFFPCPGANNLSAAFKRYARYAPGITTSLPRTCRVLSSWPPTIETRASIFAKCQAPPRARYTVHPDWRREP